MVMIDTIKKYLGLWRETRKSVGYTGDPAQHITETKMLMREKKPLPQSQNPKQHQIEAISMREGDKLLLVTPQNISITSRDALCNALEEWINGSEAVGLIGGMDKDARLVVIRKEKAQGDLENLRKLNAALNEELAEPGKSEADAAIEAARKKPMDNDGSK